VRDPNRLLKPWILVGLLAGVESAWAVEPLPIDITPAAGSVLTSGQPYQLHVETPGETGEIQLIVGGNAPDGGPYSAFKREGVAPFDLDLMIPWEDTGPYKVFIRAQKLDPVTGDVLKKTQTSHELFAMPSAREVPASIDILGVYELAAPADGEVAETVGLDSVALYADGRHRSVQLGAVGTTYASSDPDIATVDADGKVTAVAPGTAFIAVDYLGVRNWVDVPVKDPLTGRPAISEYTGQVVINRGGFRRDPASGLFVQQVSFTNTTEWPMAEPIHLVITELAQGVTMPENRKETRYVQPGSPMEYVDLPGGFTTPFLAPGATASATLKFRNNDNLPITYTLRLFGGARP
jgi:hypothetical protein